jgi:orotidine-5'-phosphate decarboxylase
VCLGLDPDPADLDRGDGDGGDAADLAAAAVAASCRSLIERAGPACVAVKLQLACFERLGAPGRSALGEVADAAREAGLLVIADGKRGDVPVSAAAYGQALLGTTPTPWGEIPGLGADAATVNPLLGGDAIDPLIDAASAAGGGVFCLVRTSNPGAADLFDLPAPDVPLHERIAAMLNDRASRLAGDSGLTGVGAVVGATEPRHLGRLRELMPAAIFLIPGVGAQGGRPDDLGPAFGEHPAAAIVTASRSIAGAQDPGRAAEELRDSLWRLG